MQGTTKGDTPFLKTSTYAKNRNATINTCSCQFPRHRITVFVVRLVTRMGFGSKVRWMNIGACSGQENTIDDLNPGSTYQFRLAQGEARGPGLVVDTATPNCTPKPKTCCVVA